MALIDLNWFTTALTVPVDVEQVVVVGCAKQCSVHRSTKLSLPLLYLSAAFAV